MRNSIEHARQNLAVWMSKLFHLMVDTQVVKYIYRQTREVTFLLLSRVGSVTYAPRSTFTYFSHRTAKKADILKETLIGPQETQSLSLSFLERQLLTKSVYVVADVLERAPRNGANDGRRGLLYAELRALRAHVRTNPAGVDGEGDHAVLLLVASQSTCV